MSEIKTSHGEFLVYYDEVDNIWIGFLGGAKISESSSLSGLKKLLDKHGKEEKMFKRVNILSNDTYHRGDKEFLSGEITSITDSGEVWITWETKKREKFSIYSYGTIFLDTPENRAKVETYSSLSNKIKELKNAQRDLKNSMDCFSRPQKEKKDGM